MVTNRREWMLGMGAMVMQPAPERVVAVGDVHGDYERFLDVLIMANVANRQGRWIGGRTTLIQLGDMLHRGPASRRALDMLMKLQPQARRAGGHVEMILGNHEVMRMIGDLRYVSPGEDAEFRTPNSPRERDVYFESYLEVLRYEGRAMNRPDLAMGFREQWEASFPLGRAEMIKAFSGRGNYGKWLRKRPVAVVAGESLFVHAGISPKYLMWDNERFVERLLLDLELPQPDAGGYLADEQSPFWWRGLVQQPEEELAGHIDDVLRRWGVRRMVVGHMPQKGRVTPIYGGKVLLADVGLSSLYSGARACVVIERGQAVMLLEDKIVQLP
jgi:hypothetical protein